MCAINPLHKKRILFDFYTSHTMSKDEFDSFVVEWCNEQEIKCNNFGRIRLHVKETKQRAD